MINIKNDSKYKQFEDRCYVFAKNVRLYFKNFSMRFYNLDDIKQVIRSSGSIGANYIEANQALGKKDFVMRLRIAKKEARESSHWLNLIYDTSELSTKDKMKLECLIKESNEIMRILGAIYHKVK